MENVDRAELLARLGLSTEALGPPEEWSPSDCDTYHRRHNAYWGIVGELIPDDVDQEPFWMTEDAAAQLAANNLLH